MGGVLSVEIVVFASPAPVLPVRGRDLEDRNPRLLHKAQEACAVAAGAFDTHADESAKTMQPGQEFLVAIWCGGELCGAQKPTSSAERGNGVAILVGVNAADDLRFGM